jgi:DNA-binding GntR family transcriptional regulator
MPPAFPDGDTARHAPLRPVTRDSLTNKAYDRIRAALMSSRFRPGQRLVLRSLAAELGISPTPVREALLRLVSEHALVLDQRSVVCVPLFDAELYREVRDLRIDLEGQAAFAAVPKLSDRLAADLVRLAGQYEDADRRGDFHAALEINERLHMKLYAAADQPVLLSLIESLWMRCGPFFTHLHERNRTRNANRHDLIVAGLKARDAKRVRAGVREDIMAGWKRLTEPA